MEVEIKGRPAFAHLQAVLGSGEEIVAEAGAMASMGAGMDMKTRLNGGLIGGLLRKIFGGETIFINTFTNRSSRPQQLVLTQPTPGDVMVRELKGETYNLQPGAFLACDKGIKLGLKWAGIASFIAREGLFKMTASGNGRVWFGGYGGLLEREVKGDFIVDTSHLVAYDPGLKLKLQLAGGIFSSFFGGEGIVTRIEGNGKIIIQTRSMDTLASWLAPKVL